MYTTVIVIPIINIIACLRLNPSICIDPSFYDSSQGELRICVLPSHMTYDSPWPIRKVPTHCTVHQASYHMESKTHVVITSEQSPIQELPLGDDPDHTEKVERGMSCDHHVMSCKISNIK